MVTNREIAKEFTEMAALLEMHGVAFKPRAYEKAALGVESLDREVKDIYKEGGIKALEQIPSVGKGIAAHIEELIKKGSFSEYKTLKKKFPVNISELLAIEGIGPKMIKILWEKLRIRNLKQLETAAKKGKIRDLPHFGLKSEQKILKGIEFLKASGGRRVLGFMLPELRSLEKMIESFDDVEKVITVGSVIRRKETIGDIDILAMSSKPEKVIERFLALPFIAHVYGKGENKVNVKFKNGLDGDLLVVPKKSFGAALNYFTGSKYHNIALREIAMKKGFKLSDKGLFRGSKMIAGETEEGIYHALGLDMPAPEIREDTGEIQAAKLKKLPDLIGYGDLRGDLQVQTDWTDGEHSIEEMAHAAQKAGLEYIAITDHTRSLAMTGGSDEKKLLKQIEEIKKIQKNFKKFRILAGAEVNIGKDGTLDIDDETLSKLDVVGAAVHSHFNLTREEQTKRVIRAMENPHVDIIFHLTGRMINKREAIDIDVDGVIAAAKRTKTVLEIDAFPDRLDIKDDYIRKCVSAGVKMSIDSDAHSTQHFQYLEVGISQARRGWATRRDIINAHPVNEMLKFLKGR
ncbi:MAG: DNA polymerase/3'-5' exonuclease PolX [bacterium]|nr:DNA polymerase/3'-5' exonuclease PolX [bacterium]MDZ4286262.1 DNA polymerase/3'-5' exonuclease PolX [Candidatus Sungbacteria bacterium]